jgi:HAMP domain-containing protein
MTDDIVKRLRKGAEYEDDSIVMDVAADRIEQLEAALDDMGQYISRADWLYLKPETRAALGEKKQ